MYSLSVYHKSDFSKTLFLISANNWYLWEKISIDWRDLGDGFRGSMETRFGSVERDVTARLIKFSPGKRLALDFTGPRERRSSSRPILINFHRINAGARRVARSKCQRKPLPAGRAGLCGTARDSDTVRLRDTLCIYRLARQLIARARARAWYGVASPQTGSRESTSPSRDSTWNVYEWEESIRDVREACIVNQEAREFDARDSALPRTRVSRSTKRNQLAIEGKGEGKRGVMLHYYLSGKCASEYASRMRRNDEKSVVRPSRIVIEYIHEGWRANAARSRNTRGGTEAQYRGGKLSLFRKANFWGFRCRFPAWGYRAFRLTPRATCLPNPRWKIGKCSGSATLFAKRSAAPSPLSPLSEKIFTSVTGIVSRMRETYKKRDRQFVRTRWHDLSEQQRRRPVLIALLDRGGKRDWDAKSERRTLRRPRPLSVTTVERSSLDLHVCIVRNYSAGVRSIGERRNMTFTQLPCETKRLLINAHRSASNRDRCAMHRICTGTDVIFISRVSRTKIVASRDSRFNRFPRNSRRNCIKPLTWI